MLRCRARTYNPEMGVKYPDNQIIQARCNSHRAFIIPKIRHYAGDYRIAASIPELTGDLQKAAPHNIAIGLPPIFSAVNSLFPLEIHKVFPRENAFFRRKISGGMLLPNYAVLP